MRLIKVINNLWLSLFWQIFLIGLILGYMITILDMFSPFKNKKVVAYDD